MASFFPEQYGGHEWGYTMLTIAMEEIAKELPAIAIHVQLQCVAGDELRKYGTEKQKQDWLVPLIRGTTCSVSPLQNRRRDPTQNN